MSGELANGSEKKKRKTFMFILIGVVLIRNLAKTNTNITYNFYILNTYLIL